MVQCRRWRAEGRQRKQLLHGHGELFLQLCHKVVRELNILESMREVELDARADTVPLHTLHTG